MCLFARRTFILCSFFISLYLPRSRLSISMFFLINNSSSFRRLYMCFLSWCYCCCFFFLQKFRLHIDCSKNEFETKNENKPKNRDKKRRNKTQWEDTFCFTLRTDTVYVVCYYYYTIIHSSLAMIPGLWILIFRDYVCLFVVVVARRRILFLDDSFLLCVCIFCCCIFFVYNIMQW